MIQLPNNKLVKQSYNTLYADGAKDPLVSTIKKILTDNNMEDTWTKQQDLPVSDKLMMSKLLTTISNTIHCNSQTQVIEKAKTESKLKYFLETSADSGITNTKY
jgi:hypothetical protein